MFGYGKNMKVILYDEDEMQCFGGYLSGVSMEQPEQIDATVLEDSNQRLVRGISKTSVEMTIELSHEIIQLDQTTMKRIARFNLEKENERLLEEIRKNKQEMEWTKEEYEEFKKRLQTISEIGTDIWEHGTEYAEKEEYEESDWND